MGEYRSDASVVRWVSVYVMGRCRSDGSVCVMRVCVCDG